jgi:hypothetical protein
MDWETVYGTTKIYETKHIVTYGGGPEGGYVYFYKERDPGWYRWHRTWFKPTTYTKVLTGHVATKFEDGVEYIGRLPDNWESLHLLEAEEDVTVLSDEVMQEN